MTLPKFKLTKSHKIWLGIGLFLAAVGTRCVFLNLIPTAFSHDELAYLINAVSVAVSGVGRYGDWSPLSLKPVEASLAELPTLFLAGFFKLPFGPMIDGRLLPVLMSLTLPFLVASISWSLFKSRRAAEFSWALALFNPWIWQNGRLTFDIPISLWCYVLGVAIFLRFQSWKKLLALMPFWLGFYSYQGFKLILPFICLNLSLFTWLEQKPEWGIWKKLRNWKKLGPGLITSLFGIGLLSYYLIFQFNAQTASQTRIANQIITPQSQVVSEAVNTDRRLALLTPINNLFINKYAQTVKEIVGRYLLVFNGRELFYEISASNSPFAVWNHGPFYLIDALLIAVGIIALIQRRQISGLLLLGGLGLTGVIPAVLNQSIWLYFRPSFLFPLLLITAGWGLEWFWQKQKKLFFLIFLGYIFSVVNFGFLYFVRYPIYASEGIYFGPRLLAEYLHRLPSDQKVVIFEKEPEFVFTNLVFYYQLLNSSTAEKIHQAYKTQTYEWNNLRFLPCVPNDFQPASDTTYVFDSDAPDCTAKTENDKKIATGKLLLANEKIGSRPIFIRSVKDNGVNYDIYHQTLCSHPEKMSHFIHPQELKQFDFSKLTSDQFCQTWLTQDLPK